MALTNDREKKICAKYSARDDNGKVHCNICPLIKSWRETMCKANSHYDRHNKEWVLDDVGNTVTVYMGVKQDE